MARVIIAKGGVYNLTQGQHKRLMQGLSPVFLEVLSRYERMVKVNPGLLLVSYLGGRSLGILDPRKDNTPQPRLFKQSALANELGTRRGVTSEGNEYQYTFHKHRAYVCRKVVKEDNVVALKRFERKMKEKEAKA